MHAFDKAQYSQMLRLARRTAGDEPGTEICGVIVDTGHHLSFVQTRNVSPRAGSFRFSRPDVRRIVAATKVLCQEVVGTFHSHPVSTATPGPSDIAHAENDSLMFIFDCIGREGRLWKIKRGKARELEFGFLHSERTAPNHALQRTATRVTVAANPSLGAFPASHLSS